MTGYGKVVGENFHQYHTRNCTKSGSQTKRMCKPETSVRTEKGKSTIFFQIQK